MNNRKIKVLIVDDSTVIRRLLTKTLSEDREIEVAGTAANGLIALAKIPTIKPDVITLDLEMPEMDGLETLIEIRKLYPKLPVIMFSTLTHRGADATLDALERGASDYVGKPANVGSVSEGIARVRSEMVPKIKALCSWYEDGSQSASRFSGSLASRAARLAADTSGVSTERTHTPPKTLATQRIDVVAIGVSTGGPNALSTLMPAIPKDFPVPIVIVQHMPPIFTKHLADRLNAKCAIEVSEACDGDVLEAGKAYIAPGDYHMETQSNGASTTVQLSQGQPENSCRPAVDVLFRSVAAAYGKNVLACVLTGMGADGKLGSEVIAEKGGRILSQDEETSVVWGMPAAVTNAGLADEILPLDEIADALVQHTRRGRFQSTTLRKACRA